MNNRNDVGRRDFLSSSAGMLGSAFGRPGSAQGQTSPSQPKGGSPSLVLRSGKIITVDDNFTIAEAVAIRDGRIVAVGPDAAMKSYTEPGTHVVDLQGKTVIPGLIDGHAHMDREGLKAIFPSLGRVRSIRDIQERIAELARKSKPGEWIVTMPIGDPPFYLDVPDILAEKRWPARQELDSAAPDNPVLIRSIWGFWRSTPPLVTCVNTAALKRAGITRETASPDPGVVIEKDKNGDPTGVLIESDMQPLVELIWFREATRFSRKDRTRAIPVSAKTYHAFGTTGVFEEHGVANEVLRAYKDARRAGTLTMRTALVFSPDWKAVAGSPLSSFMEAWAGWLGEPALGDDWLKMTGLYVNIQHRPSDDLRAKAAPYTGWAGFNYDTGMPRERLKELALECARNDIRVVANAALSPGIIEIMADVDKQIPLKGRRWIVGHVGRLSRREIAEIARMGLMITPHTNATIYKGGSYFQKALGPDHRDELTPLRHLLDAGVKVSLVTDNVPVSMFWPIWESVARLSMTNERIAPTQAITRAEALRCSTVNGAYLSFDEDKRGSIEVGKLADLAVLRADPLTVQENRIRDITSLLTIVGGRVVYEAA
ncbi:MAG TPA: amidohydrolase [Bryobacteraceae bacterium]